MINQLYYTKPAKCFEQALPLGNGRLGIMTYGNLRHERLSLNEDSLWSGYPKDQNKADAHKYLAACREAIFAKDYAKAKDILNRDMHGHWSEAYLPLGNLRIDYDRAYKKNYSRTLDLRTGVAVTRADGLTQTVFVSHPAQLVVVHIESEQPFSATCRLDSLLQSTVTAQDGTLLLTGQAPEVCMPPYYNKGETVVQGSRGMRFCAGLRADGQVTCTGDSLRIENRKEVTLLLSMATSYVDFRSIDRKSVV